MRFSVQWLRAPGWACLLATLLASAHLASAVGPGPTMASTAFRPEYCRTTPPEVHMLEGAVLEKYDLQLVQTIIRHGDRTPSSSNGFCWANESPFRCSSLQAAEGLALAPLAREYVDALAAAEQQLRAPSLDSDDYGSDAPQAGVVSAPRTAMHPLLLSARDIDDASSQTASSAFWRLLVSAPRKTLHLHRSSSSLPSSSASSPALAAGGGASAAPAANAGGRQMFAVSSSSSTLAAASTSASAASVAASAAAGPRNRGFVEALLLAHAHAAGNPAATAAVAGFHSDSPASTASPGAAAAASGAGGEKPLWESEPVPAGAPLAISDDIAATAAASAARQASAAPIFLSPYSAPTAGAAPLSMPKRFVEGWGVWPGSCHVGALTIKGHAQQWALGEALRRAYGPALGLASAAAAGPEVIYARSTDRPRTIQSLQGLLTGFLQTVPAPAPGESGYLPAAAVSGVLNKVPLHITDWQTETMVPNSRACPALGVLHKAVKDVPEWRERVTDMEEPLLQRAQRAFLSVRLDGDGDDDGNDSDDSHEDDNTDADADEVTPSSSPRRRARNHADRSDPHTRVVGSVHSLFDCAGSHLCMGNPVPSALSHDLFQELEDSVTWFERAKLSYPTPQQNAQLGIGAFISQLGSMHLRSALARAHLVPDAAAAAGAGRAGALYRGGTSGPWLRFTRLAVFSGHDTSLTAVLVALGVFDDKWPPYASHIDIELLRRSSEDLTPLLDPQDATLILDGGSGAPAPAARGASPAPTAALRAKARALAEVEASLLAEIQTRDMLASAHATNAPRPAGIREPRSAPEVAALAATLLAAVPPAVRARAKRLVNWYYTRATMHPSVPFAARRAAPKPAPAAGGAFNGPAWLAEWLDDPVRLALIAMEVARHRVRVVYNGDVKVLPFCAPAANDVSPSAPAAGAGEAGGDEFAHLADGDGLGTAPGAEVGYGLCPLARWLDALTEISPQRRPLGDAGWSGTEPERWRIRDKRKLPSVADLFKDKAWSEEAVMGFGKEASMFDRRCGLPTWMSA